jgi:signal peptidase II
MRLKMRASSTLTTGRILVLTFLMAMTVGCDRVTKHIAASTLAGRPQQSFLADMVRLDYTENSGAFLGLGGDWPPALRTSVFTVWNAISLVATATLAIRRRWSRPELVALTLFLAGGLSNLIDRVAHGSVIDFMNVGLGSFRTGIFNVADMAIMLGLALLAWNHVRSAAAGDAALPAA